MLNPALITPVIDLALAEDAPWGDVTSDNLIPADATATAVLAAREPGVLSGIDVFGATMLRCDPDAQIETTAADGHRFGAEETLARVTGNARAILRAERIALNLIQRMSGIASTTAQYVDAVAGTGVKVVDTRKTTPGLRALERHAVTSGGGHNHRFSLSDAVLVKDNHLAVITAGGRDLTNALREARSSVGHTVHFEVEVDRIDQIEPVIAAGVDTILLDNFTPDQLREGVAIVNGRATVDASGGITLDTIGEVARTGVDIISVGALTHNIRSLDLGLDITID